MAAIEGSVTIGGFIAPSDTTDTYPSHVDIYGRGGMRSVANNTERDAITSDRRSQGMFVYVLDSDGSGNAKLYTLIDGITNSDWEEVELGGGGGYWEQVSASTSIYFVPATGDGRVGIGTTSPSYKLHVDGGTIGSNLDSTGNNTSRQVNMTSANITGMNTFTVYNTNTDATPDFLGKYGYKLEGGTATANKQFQLYVSDLSNPRMVVNGSGNVGIGTTSPSAKLDVAGSIRSSLGGSWASSAGGVQITYDGVNTGTMSMYYDAQDLVLGAGVTNKNGITISGTGADNKISMKAGGSDRVTVLGSSGRVGIGTTSPAYKLDVSDDINIPLGKYIRFGSQLGIKKVNIGAMHFYAGTNNTTGGFDFATWNGSGYNEGAFVIRNSGNVGIGTTTPSAKLEVESNIIKIGEGTAATISIEGKSTTNIMRFRNAGGSWLGTQSNGINIGDFTSNVTTTYGDVRVGNYDFEVIDNSDNRLLFIKNSSGNVGIGTASPSAKLDVVGLANINDGYENLLISSYNTGISSYNENLIAGQIAQGNDPDPLMGYNVAIGSYAGYNFTSGAYNTAISSGALLNVTDGWENTAIGATSLYTLTEGNSNTGIGRNSLAFFNSGSNNIAIGTRALEGISGGSYSYSNTIAIGTQAGRNNNNNNNLFIGHQAGLSNSTGGDNVFIGYQAGYNSTGSDNVFIGYEAGYNETGSNKLYIANSNTDTPLIYGEFDSKTAKVNGELTVQDAASGVNHTTIKGHTLGVTGATVGGNQSGYSILIKDTTTKEVKELTYPEFIASLVLSGINNIVDSGAGTEDQFQQNGVVGDLNGDGTVGAGDLLVLLTQYGGSGNIFTQSRVVVDSATTTDISDATTYLSFSSSDCTVEAGTINTNLATPNSIIFNSNANAYLSAYPNKFIRIHGSTEANPLLYVNVEEGGEGVATGARITVYDQSNNVIEEYDQSITGYVEYEAYGNQPLWNQGIINIPISSIYDEEASGASTIHSIKIEPYARTENGTGVSAEINNFEVSFNAGG